MGVYETPAFAKGTEAMAQLLANVKATTVVGGGSTAEIITALGLEKENHLRFYRRRCIS